MNPRPPLPPFTEETARQKVQAAEDAWNSRDPERVALAYTEDTEWRNRTEFLHGRAEVIEFLRRKWSHELGYRLRKSLWAFQENRIAVRFEYEYHDEVGQWRRAYGNENWEFDSLGYMKFRYASINDLPIRESERKFRADGEKPLAIVEPRPSEIFSLQVGAAAEIPRQGQGEWWDKEWKTGLWKDRQSSAIWLGYEGLRGDQQADRVNHGGESKAVCVYPLEHYAYWQQIPGLSGMEPGAFGENFTTQGLTEESVSIGDIFAVRDAVIEVSQPRQPCWKIARRWKVKDLPAQVIETGRTGFYFRVLAHGEVQAGDQLRLLDRACERWTIKRCNELMYNDRDNPDELRELSGCSQLSASWKDALRSRWEASQK